jgi:hypothetical protein
MIENIGDAIRAGAARGLTQQQVAVELGVTKGVVSGLSYRLKIEWKGKPVRAAQAKGALTYFGAACSYGHGNERLMATRRCVKCAAKRMQRLWRSAAPHPLCGNFVEPWAVRDHRRPAPALAAIAIPGITLARLMAGR